MMAFYISDSLLEEYVNDRQETSLLSCMHQAIIHGKRDEFRNRVLGAVKSSSWARGVNWERWLQNAEDYLNSGLHYKVVKSEDERLAEQRKLRYQRERNRKR